MATNHGPRAVRDNTSYDHYSLLAAAIELSAVDQFDAPTADALLDPPGRGAVVIEALLRNRLFMRPTDTGAHREVEPS